MNTKNKVPLKTPIYKLELCAGWIYLKYNGDVLAKFIVRELETEQMVHAIVQHVNNHLRLIKCSQKESLLFQDEYLEIKDNLIKECESIFAEIERVANK